MLIHIRSLTHRGFFGMLEVFEVLKFPFWRFWGVMFYASLEKGKANALRLNFMFSTATFTCHPVEIALVFLHWEYEASRRVSRFLILFPLQRNYSSFSVLCFYIADHKLLYKGECHCLCLPGTNLQHRNEEWFIHVVLVVWWLSLLFPQGLCHSCILL